MFSFIASLLHFIFDEILGTKKGGCKSIFRLLLMKLNLLLFSFKLQRINQQKI